MEIKALGVGISTLYCKSVSTTNSLSRNQKMGIGNVSNLCISPNSIIKGFPSLSLKRGTTPCVSTPGTLSDPNVLERGDSGAFNSRFDGVEPSVGKSGSVSFHGLTHQMVEECNLTSAPFPEHKTSFLWVLAPVALISSLVLPQFFLGNLIEAFVKNEALLEMTISLSFDAVFYAGLWTFLLVTDRIQRPYLQFSAKRWGLITGLKGYLASAFFLTAMKIAAPLILAPLTFPVLRLSALAAVAPFLIGCAVQYAFEWFLQRRQSSCWPLIPILFEVYRLYQLTKATHFIQNLIFAMKDKAVTSEMVGRGSALVGIVMTFQVLGLICLWSLVTFLMRLFPSRPVAKNY